MCKSRELSSYNLRRRPVHGMECREEMRLQGYSQTLRTFPRWECVFIYVLLTIGIKARMWVCAHEQDADTLRNKTHASLLSQNSNSVLTCARLLALFLRLWKRSLLIAFSRIHHLVVIYEFPTRNSRSRPLCWAHFSRSFHSAYIKKGYVKRTAGLRENPSDLGLLGVSEASGCLLR